MKLAFDVPGYLCGHRYTQDSRYYDAAGLYYRDLALYGNHARRTAGVPAFSLHGANSREGVLLNNAYHMEMDNPIPWEGTAIVVAKVHTPSPPNLYTYLFGDATTATSNGMLMWQTSGFAMAASSGVLSTGHVPVTQDAIFVAAFAMDQETRKAYRTGDGVTVTESAVAIATVNGNAMAMGWNGNPGLTGSIGNRMVRIGNTSGVVGDVVANATNYAWLFEDHWFKGNALRNSLPLVKEFMDSLKSEYAVTAA